MLLLLLRCLLIFPLMIPLGLISVACGDPDALDAAGYLLGMWATSGSAAPCKDILRLARERAERYDAL